MFFSPWPRNQRQSRGEQKTGADFLNPQQRPVLRDIRPQATGSAALAGVLTWAAGTALSAWILESALAKALTTGLLITLGHWLALFIHHSGHALAARSVGRPMEGIRLWWWLGTSLYPKEEPLLDAGVHIRRALGGPVASISIALIATPLVLAFGRRVSPLSVSVSIFALDNFLVFGLGSLVPLGFNDGSTLLRWIYKNR